MTRTHARTHIAQRRPDCSTLATHVFEQRHIVAAPLHCNTQIHESTLTVNECNATSLSITASSTRNAVARSSLTMASVCYRFSNAQLGKIILNKNKTTQHNTKQGVHRMILPRFSTAGPLRPVHACAQRRRSSNSTSSSLPHQTAVARSCSVCVCVCVCVCARIGTRD